MASLYATFGERIEAADAPPGTSHTAASETIDNDRAFTLAPDLAVFGPGTTHTYAVETIDNDRALTVGLGLAAFGPGTRVSESVETIDDDHATTLTSILRSSVAQTSLASVEDPRAGD